MARLTKCVECGKTVSSDASVCPHCHNDPWRRYCRICGKRIESSEKRGGASIHRSCREVVGAQEYCCPTCGRPLFSLEAYDALREYSCPACGQPIERNWETCYRCGFHIPPGHKVVVNKHPGMGDDSSYIHESCLAGAKAEGYKVVLRDRDSSGCMGMVLLLIGVILGACVATARLLAR